MNTPIEAIIFDMDGVLVDVKSSYREAIKKTVAAVLKESFAQSREISDTPIEILKRIPGFNNDWDLSYALIMLMSKNIPESDYQVHITPVTPEIRTTPQYKRAQDIFQGFYLGEQLYTTLYRRSPPVAAPVGLITKETLLIRRELLQELKNRFSLAIATSRPRFEAIYALTNLQLMPSIFTEETVVAQEDAPREKPFPDPLLEAQKRINKQHCIYVGDTINDITAAQKAGMKSIYIGSHSLGDYQLSDVNNLNTIL